MVARVFDKARSLRLLPAISVMVILWSLSAGAQDLSSGIAARDCCAPHIETGCDDGACSACVCGVDGVCCNEVWDAVCVAIAGEQCAKSCPCPPSPTCSECTCAGDRDGNGKVNIDEVVTVVQNALQGCSRFRWYRDCTPRVEGTHVCPPSVVACTTEEAGASCSEPSATCCLPESLCNAFGACDRPLSCTDRDPASTFRCRQISRRRFKRDIEYLTPSDLERLRSKLLATNLTRFRYKDESSSTTSHLGFIIEDVEPSPSVDSQNDAVDLYGYVSMAVATIQVQEAEIQALRREVDALRPQMCRPESDSSP